MQRTYEYRGFVVDVSVEADFAPPSARYPAAPAGYVALVTIHRSGDEIAAAPPLRLGDDTGRPFATEIAALSGGYAAARKLVDDLSSRDPA